MLSGICLLGIGGLLLWLGSYYTRRGQRLLARADYHERLMDAFERDIAESQTCCRSIIYLLGGEARCECFRCRRERGERVTDETQKQSELIQEQAALAFTANLKSGA